MAKAFTTAAQSLRRMPWQASRKIFWNPCRVAEDSGEPYVDQRDGTCVTCRDDSETLAQWEPIMKVTTNVRCDGRQLNHNQTLKAASGLPVKTNVKCGMGGSGGS